MEFRKFTAGPDDQDRRIDRIIRRILPPGCQSAPYELLRKGLIKLNGKKADGATKVASGDEITIAAFLFETAPKADTRTASDDMQEQHLILQTVFRNEFLWIVNKPYGIPVQPSLSSTVSLSQIVDREYCTQHRQKLSLSFRPGPLHRLDRNTTGLLVFSQNLAGAQWFTKAISGSEETHSIKKSYIGIVQGLLTQSALWTDGLLNDEVDTSSSSTINKLNNRSSMNRAPVFDHSEQTADRSLIHESYVRQPSPENTFKTVTISNADKGLCAITRAFPLACGNHRGIPVTLVQFDIATGRKHQIRAQSSFHGYPLIGDTAYGGIPLSADRLFYLHAVRLIVPKDNPVGLPEQLTAALGPDFESFLNSALIKWDGGLIL